MVAPAGVQPEEAAAIAAAIQRFVAETTAVVAGAEPAPNPWLVAALREGVRRSPEPDLPWR